VLDNTDQAMAELGVRPANLVRGLTLTGLVMVLVVAGIISVIAAPFVRWI